MSKKEENQLIEEQQEKKGFDRVWDRLPHISWYQLRITTLPSVASLVGGFMSIYPVFAQFKPQYRCQTALDKVGLDADLSFQEIFDLTTSTPYCQGYQSNQLGGCFFCDFSPETIASCDSTSFSSLKSCLGKRETQENSTWRSCEDYQYDRGTRGNETNFRGEQWETAVTEFTLHCGMEWFDSLSTALGLLGLLGGAFLAGLYSDRFGRKNSLLLWHAVVGALLIIMSFMTTKWGYLVFRIFSNGIHHTSWLAFVVYSLEVLGPSKRAVSGATTHIYYGVGYMLTSILGYYFPDWRDFTFAIAVIHLVTLVVAPFFPESPSFLYAKKKPVQARKILKTFSEKTNKSLDDKFLDQLEAEINEKNNTELNNEMVKKFTIIDLFCHRLLAKNTLIIAFGFFSGVLGYYGLSFNVSSLSGNLYLNNAINGFMEIISYIVVMTLMEFCGRRWCCGGIMFFGGIVSLLCGTLQLFGYVNGVRWLSFIGKFAVSGALCSIYIFAGEIFPTEIRSTGIGFGSMVGRLGGFMSPFIIQISNKVLVYSIFGIVGVLGGGLVFMLPEVKGKPIHHTIEEAVEFYEHPKGKPESMKMRKL